MKVGIYGGSGYAGAELVRLLAGHPEVGALEVSSRGYAGRGISEVFPQLAAKGDYVEPEEIDSSSLDAAFVAYGHGESAAAVERLLGAGARLVVDLSADFRLSDIEVYEEWYGEHPAPALLKESHYGLPEVFGVPEGRLARVFIGLFLRVTSDAYTRPGSHPSRWTMRHGVCAAF